MPNDNQGFVAGDQREIFKKIKRRSLFLLFFIKGTNFHKSKLAS